VWPRDGVPLVGELARTVRRQAHPCSSSVPRIGPLHKGNGRSRGSQGLRRRIQWSDRCCYTAYPRGVAEVEERQRPRLLLGAAGLVGLEALALVVLGVLELANLHATRVVLAVSTALFFLVFGAGLLACAGGLVQVRSWARGPVVAVQLITLLLAFSFWGGETTAGAVALALVSVVVLVGVLHPASMRALARDDEQG
jgi:hypothetical protein